MTHRTRVRTALSHRQADRVPVDIGGTILSSATPEMQRRIADVLGLKGEPDPRFGRFDDRIQRHFDTDLRSVCPRKGAKWGFRKTTDAPMRNLTADEVARWPWPEPSDEMVAGLRDEVRWLHDETDYFICAGQVGQGLFELGCWLRGYDQMCLDLAMDEAFVHAFFRKILAVNIELGDLYYGEIGPFVDMVIVGDDLATQTGPFMSPEMFRRLIKPYFAEYIASIRRHCPGAFIAHHSCGSTIALLDDLAEIGVQVVNPVQTSAVGMSPEALAAKKPKLAFHGGGDLQHILPHASAAEVAAFTRHMVQQLGTGGGYILAPCHTLPDDVKPENIVTMLSTAINCSPGE